MGRKKSPATLSGTGLFLFFHLPFLRGGEGILATSYFRTPLRRTIIGAAAFHFRVRNGNGWGHCAMITRGTRGREQRFFLRCALTRCGFWRLLALRQGFRLPSLLFSLSL